MAAGNETLHVAGATTVKALPSSCVVHRDRTSNPGLQRARHRYGRKGRCPVGSYHCHVLRESWPDNLPWLPLRAFPDVHRAPALSSRSAAKSIISRLLSVGNGRKGDQTCAADAIALQWRCSSDRSQRSSPSHRVCGDGRKGFGRAGFGDAIGSVISRPQSSIQIAGMKWKSHVFLKNGRVAACGWTRFAHPNPADRPDRSNILRGRRARFHAFSRTS